MPSTFPPIPSPEIRLDHQSILVTGDARCLLLDGDTCVTCSCDGACLAVTSRPVGCLN